jgi:hypothetical protein
MKKPSAAPSEPAASAAPSEPAASSSAAPSEPAASAAPSEPEKDGPLTSFVGYDVEKKQAFKTSTLYEGIFELSDDFVVLDVNTHPH